MSSFKIYVTSELFNTLLENTFWPLNTLVKVFVFKDRSKNVASFPKN